MESSGMVTARKLFSLLAPANHCVDPWCSSKAGLPPLAPSVPLIANLGVDACLFQLPSFSRLFLKCEMLNSSQHDAISFYFSQTPILKLWQRHSDCVLEMRGGNPSFRAQEWMLALCKVSLDLYLEWIERQYRLDSATENGMKSPRRNCMQNI